MDSLMASQEAAGYAYRQTIAILTGMKHSLSVRVTLREAKATAMPCPAGAKRSSRADNPDLYLVRMGNAINL